MNNVDNSQSVEENLEEKQPEESKIKLKTISEAKAEIMQEMTQTFAKTITNQVMQNIQRHFLIDDKYKPQEETVEQKPLTDAEKIQAEVDSALKELKFKK